MKKSTLGLLIALSVVGAAAAGGDGPFDVSAVDRIAAGRGTPGAPHRPAVPPPPQAITDDPFDRQFITHWVGTSSSMAGTINDDLIGEAGFRGMCSNGPIADFAEAPSIHPDYWTGNTIATGYYHAYDPETCTYDSENQTMYFYTWLMSEGDQELEVVVGASDYFKLWLDGELVLSRFSGDPAPWVEDRYRAQVTLRDGWNHLLFKHSFPQLGPPDDPDPNNLFKYFSLRFVDGTGMPARLVAAFDPLCDYHEADGFNSRVVIQSIAHLAGAGGSQWRTDALLHNGTHLPWYLGLRYFREGNASGVPDSVTELVLEPFASLNVEDALHNEGLFGMPGDQKGYFEVLHQSAQLLQGSGWLQTKVYNQAPGGTFGMSIPVRRYFDGNSSRFVFFGLRHGDYRSNFGMVPWENANAGARLRLTLYGADLPAPVSREFGPFEGMWQLNDVFEALGVPEVDTATANLYVEILANANETFWLPYVAINDGNPDGTSDPIFFTHGFLGSRPPELDR